MDIEKEIIWIAFTKEELRILYRAMVISLYTLKDVIEKFNGIDEIPQFLKDLWSGRFENLIELCKRFKKNYNNKCSLGTVLDD